MIAVYYCPDCGEEYYIKDRYMHSGFYCDWVDCEYEGRLEFDRFAEESEIE